jgi:hypothetical protein
MSVIGQCLDNGDSSGTSALMDVYETLLVLVRQALFPASTRSERTLRKPHCSANTSLASFNFFWNVEGIATMIPTSGSLR